MSGVKCGMCMAYLGDVLIGYGGFHSRYHATRVCLGLPDSAIDAIKEYGSGSFNFSCTSCKLDEGSGSNGPQYAVLLMVVEV